MTCGYFPTKLAVFPGSNDRGIIQASGIAFDASRDEMAKFQQAFAKCFA